MGSQITSLLGGDYNRRSPLGKSPPAAANLRHIQKSRGSKTVFTECLQTRRAGKSLPARRGHHSVYSKELNFLFAQIIKFLSLKRIDIDMKKFIILFCVLFFLGACDNPKAIRHLIRSAQRANQIEKKKEPEKVIDLLGFSSTVINDTTVLTANYLLPSDTVLFILTTIYNMPQLLGFEGKLDYCKAKAYYYNSLADTASKRFVASRSIEFTANGNFYDIKIRKP